MLQGESHVSRGPLLGCSIELFRGRLSCKRWNRELTLKCKFKCYVKPMKDPLGVSPSKGNHGTTRGRETILLTLVGIEPTTSGLDLPLLCRRSYEVGQRESGTVSLVASHYVLIVYGKKT